MGANDFIRFKDVLVKDTYSNIKSLRDKGELNPGMVYQITDYNCTTTQDETRSANHQFDIILFALNNNTFSEEACAINHAGDTYFSKANLAAWKIWYCIDNDVSRFLWADTQNGKGVVYRMIDEFGNDCPYDFKNIQFKRYKITTNTTNLSNSAINGGYYGIYGEGFVISNKSDYIWCYTFNLISNINDNFSNPLDASLNDFPNTNLDGNLYHENERCTNNVIRNNYYFQTLDDNTSSQVISLNNIVFLNEPDSTDDSSNIRYDLCQDNIFGEYCYNMTFGTNARSNSFGNYCDSNSFGNNCYSNSFGNNCDSNKFTYTSSSGTSGPLHYCRYFHFDDGVSYLDIKGTPTSATNWFQNYNFVRGLTVSGRLTINLQTIGNNYRINIVRLSNGQVTEKYD